MKLTKGKILAIAVVVCILAGAFFLPGQGRDTAGQEGTQSPSPVSGAPAGETSAVTEQPSQPEEHAPVEIESAEITEAPALSTEPVETEPVETEPEQTKPVESEPVVSQPAEESQGPAPSQSEVEEQTPEPEDQTLKCTLSISCATILHHMDKLTPGKEGLVPADGWLLPAVEVEFEEGECAFDVLKRELQQRKMHFEYSASALYETAYVEGICNLYEYDCGELSGWKYAVNGLFPGYGCSQYTLSHGDVITFVYTCDLGADVGAVING